MTNRSGTVLSILNIYFHLILKNSLWSICYHQTHFIRGKNWGRDRSPGEWELDSRLQPSSVFLCWWKKCSRPAVGPALQPLGPSSQWRAVMGHLHCESPGGSPPCFSSYPSPEGWGCPGSKTWGSQMSSTKRDPEEGGSCFWVNTYQPSSPPSLASHIFTRETDSRMHSACQLTPKREFIFPGWTESCLLRRVIF